MQGCDNWNLTSKGMYEKTNQGSVAGMYNGWSNVEPMLIKKHALVVRHYRKSGVETKYSLTKEGRTLGTLLHACAHFKQLCACNGGIKPCASVWSKVVVDQWSTKALKAECKRLGIAVSGKKSDLVGRIKKQRVVAKKNKKMMEKMVVKKNKKTAVAEQLMTTPIKHTKPQQKKKNATPSSHQHTIQRFFKSVKKKKGSSSSPAMRTLFGSRRTGRKAREVQSSSSSSGTNVNVEEDDDDDDEEEEEEEEQDNDDDSDYDDSDFDIDCVSLPSDDSETESDIEM